jgi:hypothetical protein
VAAVSTELLETIIELQHLSSLKNAALAGATNLAIRYDHDRFIIITYLFLPVIY